MRSNFDTLYSICWADLTREPALVSVPDTNGRYYLLPMLDMWSDVFASPGWRTTGTQAHTFLLGIRKRGDPICAVKSCWPNSNSPKENSNHHRADALRMDHRPDQDRWTARLRCGAQDSSRLQVRARVAARQKLYASPPVKIDPSVDMKTPPKVQVDTMVGDKYFAYAAELLKVQPPHVTDEPILARMKRLGIEPGKEL